MTSRTLLWLLKLKPWQRILIIILAILLLPFTLVALIILLKDNSSSYDMKMAEDQKEKRDREIEEMRETIEWINEDKKRLLEEKKEILRKAKETNEKANTISSDIDDADNIDKLESIRQHIGRLK